MRAFISYQTQDRAVAAEVRAFLDSIAFPSFLAHEDIEVSRAWQEVILDELRRADIFVAILSRLYSASSYCMQESGIAVFQGQMTILPFSIDESVPPGFMAHIQSRRIQPGNVSHSILFAGIANYDLKFAIDCMINQLGASQTFATAEEKFELLDPYLERASEEQIVDILDAAAANNQIRYAWGIKDSLRDLLASHGHLLKENNRNVLETTLNP